MKRILIKMAMGAVVLLSACKKEAVVTNNPTPLSFYQESKASLNFADSIANTANPFDSIGAIHNQALKATWDYVQKSGDTSSNGIRMQVAQFFSKRYGSDVTAQLSQMEFLYHQDYPAGVLKVSAQNAITPLMAGYLNQIVAMVKLINKPTGYKSFNASIASLEQKIMADKQLTALQKEKALMVSSISRYSIAFWIDKANRLGEHQEASTEGFFHRLLQAINCGLTDIAAGASGIGRFESPREVLEDASVMSSLASAFM